MIDVRRDRAPADRRYASPPGAGLQFGGAIHASPCLPAGVTEFVSCGTTRAPISARDTKLNPHAKV